MKMLARVATARRVPRAGALWCGSNLVVYFELTFVVIEKLERNYRNN